MNKFKPMGMRTFMAGMAAMLVGGFGGALASASSTQKRSSSRRQQPRLDAQVHQQAAQAKRDRRALRNLRIKARGGYGR
jgi:phosphoribosylformylglycinamidine (FGAM) synthase-like enzyme